MRNPYRWAVPYKPTGRPPGRPRKNPARSAEPTAVYRVELAQAGAEYIERRALILDVTATDVIRFALREYAKRYPLPPST